MKDAAPHLRTLEGLERTCIPGLVEVLREEGIDAVRYAVWGATGWHRGYSSPALRHQATAEQKRRGRETTGFAVSPPRCSYAPRDRQRKVCPEGVARER
jgi:hypothetical protein